MTKRLFGLFFFIAIISCKEDEFEPPLVLTGEVVDITATSATFTGKITNQGKSSIIESGFIWGLHDDLNPDNSLKLKNEFTPDGVYSLKSNESFLPGRTYYVRAYVKSASTLTYGEIRPFTVGGSPAEPSGKWSIVLDQFPGSLGNCNVIISSFTLNNATYLVLQTGNGELYKFDHITNSFSFVVSDPILSSATFSCVYDEVVYIFSGNSMYTFNPTTKSFTLLAIRHLGLPLYGTVGFLIGADIYVGLGVSQSNNYSKEFSKYSITENRWQEIAPFAGDFKVSAFGFSAYGRGYVGSGYNTITPGVIPIMNDLWRYEPATNNWAKQENLPFNVTDVLQAVGTQMVDFGYAYYKKQLVEYNPVFDIWEFKANMSIDTYICYPYLFTHNNRIFLASIVEGSGTKSLTLLAYEK